MKINQKPNLWKVATLFFGATTLCLLVLTAFTKDDAPEKPAAPQQSVNSTLIVDRAEAKALYTNFLRINAKFTQQGGSINKATLAGLLSKMTDPKDSAVFYYLGANTANQNVIMLFNNPTYSPLLDAPKYKTIAPFCPPNCNKTLNDYLTQ